MAGKSPSLSADRSSQLAFYCTRFDLRDESDFLFCCFPKLIKIPVVILSSNTRLLPQRKFSTDRQSI